MIRVNDIIRKKIYIIIFRSDTRAGKFFDVVLLILILLSILSVFLESVASVRERFYFTIHVLEWIFTILFTLEYLLRIYASHKPIRYIFSFYGIVDLIAVIPTYLSLFFLGTQYLVVVRAFRLLRVFRILKLPNFSMKGTF